MDRVNLSSLVYSKQTKLYELEGQVRRGVAERGVAEIKKNEFQEEIQRQKEQTTRIESLCKRQLEGAQNICSQEKVHIEIVGWTVKQQHLVHREIWGSGTESVKPTWISIAALLFSAGNTSAERLLQHEDHPGTQR